jgi:TolB-like protein
LLYLKIRRIIFFMMNIKKICLCIIPLLMLFAGCADTPNPMASRMTLDRALAEAAIQIDERIEAGTKIAALNFNSPTDRFTVYVLDELTANLVDTGKLIVVDRSEIDLIRREFDFQYSGDVADDSMQRLGQMLGAQSIISGSLTDMGGFYRIVIRVLNVQSASVEVQYRANIMIDHTVTSLLMGGRVSGTPR